MSIQNSKIKLGKWKTLFLAVLVFLVGTLSKVEAQAKRFGLGFAIGAPTDISAKYWLSGTTALDFGLGWGAGYGYDRYGDCWDNGYYNRHAGYCNDRGYYYDDGRYGFRGVHFHMDYLIHNFSLFHSSEKIGLYYGPGVELNFWKHGSIDLGARGDIGIVWMPRSAPFDLFFELTPVMMLIPGTYLDFDAGLGARFYF